MYTPAIEHFSPVQTKRSYRPTCCAFDNNAEVIIISDGHLTGRRHAFQHSIVWSALIDHSTYSLRWHPALSVVSSLTHATQCI